MEVFGFHSFDENIYSEDDYAFAETYYDAQNVLNVMGWFPILGSITGTIRLIGTGATYVSDDESFRSEHKKYYIVSALRGIVEVFSLGWLFIIPDIIASFKRKRRIRMELRKRKTTE